jgi:hypothetical protein
MAQSPAHRFGQIVGDVLESAIEPYLERFARRHDLYLDRKGDRPCRRGKKCAWVDLNGNSHDLDFVLERGGSPNQVGLPIAFIETAWRRYTKHSRNKVQEIQGAVEPLAETYQKVAPFKGAILAGVFTEGAVNQLRSLGFTVLFFPYESIVSVFREFGVDAASDEITPDREFDRKVKAYSRLSEAEKSQLAATLVKKHVRDVNKFLKSLASVVLRQIDRIVILVLHGGTHEVTTVDDAVAFIAKYSGDRRPKPIHRIEVEIRFNNGNILSGKFGEKDDAIEFLRSFEAVPHQK